MTPISNQDEPEYVEYQQEFAAGVPRVRVSASVDLTPAMYEAIQSAARSAGVSLKMYMKGCFIFGLEKGWR